MKRLITLVSAISVLVISCQQNLTPDCPDTAPPADEVMTKSLSSGRVNPDDPVVFLPATDMKAWTDIGPLEDRFAACEVPASRLNVMTTEALVKSMMNYPLNYLVLFYENPQYAIDLIIKNSPLHQEFLSRSDAAEVFIDFYAAAGIDMSLEKSDYDGDYTSLSYANSMFMDHFLGSRLMSGLGKASVKQKLTEAVSNKLQERLLASDTFGRLSITPLIKINEAEGLGIPYILQNDSRSSNEITVYTILEKAIDAYDYEEMSGTEMESVINVQVTQYPNAIVRGSATQKYNSHSYAWYESSLYNEVWINYEDHEYNPQLQKFWTNDAYVECSESEAEVVLYTDFQHSAVKLSNGNYLSKWYNGLLMEHAPSYGPYMSDYRRYFKLNFTPKIGGVSVSGTNSVSLNQQYYYNVVSPKSYLTYSWEVRFMDAPDPKPYLLTIDSSDGRFCKVVFQDYGYYKIKVTAYNRGYQVGTGQFEVLALPPM